MDAIPNLITAVLVAMGAVGIVVAVWGLILEALEA